MVERCNICNRELQDDKTVWLELSIDDGEFYSEEDFPKEHNSQGLFPFGITCAKKTKAKKRSVEQ